MKLSEQYPKDFFDMCECGHQNIFHEKGKGCLVVIITEGLHVGPCPCKKEFLDQ